MSDNINSYNHNKETNNIDNKFINPFNINNNYNIKNPFNLTNSPIQNSINVPNNPFYNNPFIPNAFPFLYYNPKLPTTES